MHQTEFNRLVAGIITFFMLCFLFAGMVLDSAFNLHFSNCRDTEPEPVNNQNSLSASSLPKAYFLPDERNFVSDRQNNFFLNYYHITVMNVIMLLVSSLCASQVLDKHTKRLFKLQI